MILQGTTFLLGVVLVHRLPQLWPLPQTVGVVGVGCLVILLWPLRTKPLMWHLIPWLLLGLMWTHLHAQWRLADRLTPELEGVDLIVVGKIASLPQSRPDGVRFLFHPLSAQWGTTAVQLPRLMRLGWYDVAGTLELVPGAQWQLKVRLKRPHGMHNPGGFDYEGWLFAQGIGATGNVRHSAHNIALSPATPYSLDRIRYGLFQRLDGVLSSAGQHSGVIPALVLGIRDGISPELWDRFLATGTNHLVAISGLHVGLVAGMVYALGYWGWSRWSWGRHRLPSPQAAAVMALLSALLYAALAGFSLPTQRALIMITVALAAVIIRRPLRPFHQLGVALILVLLWDPWAPLSAGFWLSFGAVGWLLFGLGGRYTKRRGQRQTLRRYTYGLLQVQWVLLWGLLPLMALWFGRVSLVAPLANLIAVPLVGVVVVPLALLGSLLLPLFEPLSRLLLLVADGLMDWVIDVLAVLETLLAPYEMVVVDGWLLIPALLGSVWLLMPPAWPARWIGVVGMGPLLWLAPTPIEPGQAQVTLLDVGQGLAVVVETRSHTLVFDTGPRFRSGFNTGEAVLLPFLRQRGVQWIDRLIISHADLDHIGGAESLAQRMPIRALSASLPLSIADLTWQPCRAGEGWQWDGVNFLMLHPDVRDASASENDLSCVLQIDAGGERLLLPGDIESPTESQMVARYGNGLAANYLVAPHHGSKSSSSLVWIERVAPAWVLVPAGYRNRYRFPHPQVVGQINQQGAAMLISYQSGAIGVRLGSGRLLAPSQYRLESRRYWHSTGSAL